MHFWLITLASHASCVTFTDAFVLKSSNTHDTNCFTSVIQYRTQNSSPGSGRHWDSELDSRPSRRLHVVDKNYGPGVREQPMSLYSESKQGIQRNDGMVSLVPSRSLQRGSEERLCRTLQRTACSGQEGRRNLLAVTVPNNQDLSVLEPRELRHSPWRQTGMSWPPWTPARNNGIIHNTALY
jgi:hypothetical protein